MTEIVGTEEGTAPFTWYARKCPSCDWAKQGQIGGANTSAKDAVPIYRDTVTSLWTTNDTRDFKLVDGNQTTMIESTYVNPKTEGDLSGDCPDGQQWDTTTQACVPIPPTVTVDEWEQYYPWIYAAVAIGIAGLVIYLMFFGPSPLINKVQQKVS